MEQGGVITTTLTDVNLSASFTVNFPKSMKESGTYTNLTTFSTSHSYSVLGGLEGFTKTTMNGFYRASEGTFPRTITIKWFVSGMVK